MIISIIPDTNVLIKSLDIIERIVQDDHPYNIRVIILTNVLYELDKLKKNIIGARKAISYILENNGDKLFIEGSVNDRKMDIIEDGSESTKDNVPVDLLIVGSAACMEHSVILTADKNMILFCKSKNVKAIFTEGLQYEKLKLAIYISHTDMEEMEVIEDNIVCDKKLTEECLKPIMLKIIGEEIGPGVDLYQDKIRSYTIEQLIDFIVKNFFLFENFIPRNSKQIFTKLNRELRGKEQKESIKRALQNILTIFRINYKL